MFTEGSETSNSSAFSVVVRLAKANASSSTHHLNELENEERRIRQPLLEGVPASDEQVQNAIGASNSHTNTDRETSLTRASSSEDSPGIRFKQAIDDFNTKLVEDFLKRISNDSIPFDTGAQLIKDNIEALLKEYRTLFETMLKNDELSKNVCTIQVPVEIFESDSNVGITIGTCDSISELTALSMKDNAFENWPAVDKKGVNRIMRQKRGRMVMATVKIFHFADVCKTGANGIIRSFLMHEMPTSVFKTSLIKSIIDFKWENTWKFRAWRRLAFYLAFLVIVNLTVLAIGLKWLKGSSVTIQCIIASVIISLMIIVAINTLWGEFFQLKRYIRDGHNILPSKCFLGVKHYFGSRQNQIDLALSFSLLITFTLLLLEIFVMAEDEYAIANALWWFVVFDVLLIWAKALYLAQAIKRIGVFVLMIGRVIRECLPYFVLLFGFMVGFGFAMYVALIDYTLAADGLLECYDNWSHYQDWTSSCIWEYSTKDVEDKCHNASDFQNPSGLYCYRELISHIEDMERITEFFDTPLSSILTMGYAMMGLFDPEVLFRTYHLSRLVIAIFVIYMALQTTVMFNMLIAAMGDAFDGVRTTEEESFMKARAEFIDQYEALLHNKTIRTIDGKIGKYLCVLVPEDQRVNKIVSLWRGRMTNIKEDVRKIVLNFHQDITQKMDKLTQKVDQRIESEHQFTQNMDRQNQDTQQSTESMNQLMQSIARQNQDIQLLTQKMNQLTQNMSEILAILRND